MTGPMTLSRYPMKTLWASYLQAGAGFAMMTGLMVTAAPGTTVAVVLIVLAALDLNKLGLPDTLVESENISLYRIVVIVALVGWTTVARLVRGTTLSLRERDFVRAALADGVHQECLVRR